MIRSSIESKLIMLVIGVGMPLLLAAPVYAATGDMTQVESFIRSIIKLIAGLYGLVATGFFVAGGFTYTHSRNGQQ